jgi:hypothetical protein
MDKKKHTKLIHAGHYAAKVDVELIHDDSSWSPYLSVEDALKLDQVRQYLREGNLTEAQKIAEVFELKPVAA